MRSGTCSVFIAVILSFPLTVSVCSAEEIHTIIIYPKVKAPIQQIYSDITKGIKQVAPLSETLAIDDDTQTSHLEAILQQIKPEKIIALGRRTADKVVRIGYQDQMIVAAALFDPSEYQGVSLAIDSRILLKEINSLLPFVKKVFVLGNPTRPSITIYPESLHGQPLIIPLYHEDPLINTRQLWRLLDKEASKIDAIILPSHLDRDILYELAQLAWEKKIILLSTNLAHLKEGILMVFYPDNIGMGQQIGTFATEHNKRGYQSLTHINTAFNTTIAKHLGLEFSPDAMNQFQIKIK